MCQRKIEWFSALLISISMGVRRNDLTLSCGPLEGQVQHLCGGLRGAGGEGPLVRVPHGHSFSGC